MMKSFFGLVLAVVILGGSMASTAEAFDLAAFRQRSAERIEQYTHKIVETTDRVTGNTSQTPAQSDTQGQTEAIDVSCDATIDLERPQVRWSGNNLVLVPTVRARLTSDGEPGGSWQANLNYTGSVEFLDGTMTLPSNSTFAGSHSWSGPTGDSRFRFSGQALAPIPLAQLDRLSFGRHDELEGRVRITGQVSGCDADQFDEQFTFTVRQYGDIRSGSWRRVR